MNRPIVGAIDGDKLHSQVFTLMDTLPKNRLHLGGYHTGKRDAYLNVIAEMKECKISDQGEATRLREALIKAESFISKILAFCGQDLHVANWHQNGDLEPWDNFFDENMDGDELEVIREALSPPHREDGIQKVRELWKWCCDSHDLSAANVLERALEHLGITIPGITEER